MRVTAQEARQKSLSKTSAEYILQRIFEGILKQAESGYYYADICNDNTPWKAALFGDRRTEVLNNLKELGYAIRDFEDVITIKWN